MIESTSEPKALVNTVECERAVQSTQTQLWYRVKRKLCEENACTHTIIVPMTPQRPFKNIDYRKFKLSALRSSKLLYWLQEVLNYQLQKDETIGYRKLKTIG